MENSNASTSHAGIDWRPPGLKAGKSNCGPAEGTVRRSARQTNQAERAAMHPEGHDLEWHYYHGAWSG